MHKQRFIKEAITHSFASETGNAKANRNRRRGGAPVSDAPPGELRRRLPACSSQTLRSSLRRRQSPPRQPHQNTETLRRYARVASAGGRHILDRSDLRCEDRSARRFECLGLSAEPVDPVQLQVQRHAMCIRSGHSSAFVLEVLPVWSTAQQLFRLRRHRCYRTHMAMLQRPLVLLHFVRAVMGWQSCCPQH